VVIAKVHEFITFACAQEEFQRCQKLKFPSMKHRNKPYLDVDTIKLHLYQWGFQAHYYRWVHHGEPFLDEEGAYSLSSNVEVTVNPMCDMVMYAYTPTISLLLLEVTHNEEQEPIPDANRFLQLLQAAKRPLYKAVKCHC